MPADNNLILKSSGAHYVATSIVTGSSVDFSAGDLKPITYRIAVTAVTSSPTLNVVIQEAAVADTSTATFLTLAAITAVGSYFVTGVSSMRYRNVVGTLTGAGSAATWQCDAMPAGRYNNF